MNLVKVKNVSIAVIELTQIIKNLESKRVAVELAELSKKVTQCSR